jgi:hypothetical protein
VATSNFFTLKLCSEKQLKKLSIGNEFGSKVIIEGFLGEIKKVANFEGTLVRIEFEKGEINIDINLQDIARLLKKEGDNGSHGGK